MTKTRILISLLCLSAISSEAQDRSISLQECLDLSHTGGKTVVNAALDVKAARSQKQEALAAWFPTASVSAGGFKAWKPIVDLGLNDILGNSDAAYNFRHYIGTISGIGGIDTHWSFLNDAYTAALNVTQPVYAGGRIANGNALASLGVKAADVRNRMAVRDNDDEVTGKYWTVIALTEKKKALQQGIDLLVSLEGEVTAALEAGLAKESELLQLKIKRKDLETKMLRLCSGERLAKMDLFNVIGLEYSLNGIDGILLSDTFEDLPAPENQSVEMESLAHSLEESELLEMSVESKKLQKKMTLGEALPEVMVGASYGWGKIVNGPRDNGLLYAMIKIPLTDWGKTSQKLHRCQYEIEKAQNEREFLEKQLVVKLSKEWNDVQCAWEEVLAAKETLSLSEILETQKKAEYDAGLCTLSELLQCQAELQNSRSSLVDSQSSYCTALAIWSKSRR